MNEIEITGLLDDSAAAVLLNSLHFGGDDLIPAVLQDSASMQVLMIGFMNREALAWTLNSGLVHFWSRSRGKLWLKGESSGNFQRVAEVRVNCENNSLLLLVSSSGPVCHEGYATCYFRRVQDDGTLAVVETRYFDPATVYPGNH